MLNWSEAGRPASLITGKHDRRMSIPAWVLTNKGRRSFDAAMPLQVPWVHCLSERLSVKELQTFPALSRLCGRN
jgi:hypothetical protein